MVSVCVTTYNGSRYISQQITSIISQLGPQDEIILSDDGSTDDTLSIVKSFNDERIKIFEVGFRSAAKNFGYAISKTTGDYIFLSDQDDIWMSNKVEICISLLHRYDVVVTDCNIIDAAGKETAPSLYRQINSGSGLIKNLLSNTYYGCCMCFKKEIIPVICPFPVHVPMHDSWIGFATGLFYSVVFDKHVLVSYRRHGKNITSLAKSTAPLSVKLKRRVNLLRYFPLLLRRRLMLNS